MRTSTKAADNTNYKDEEFFFTPKDVTIGNAKDYIFKEKCFVVITDLMGEVYGVSPSGFFVRRSTVYNTRAENKVYMDSKRKPIIEVEGDKVKVDFNFIAIGN